MIQYLEDWGVLQMPPCNEKSQCRDFTKCAKNAQGKAWENYAWSWKGFEVPIDPTVPHAKEIANRARHTLVRKTKGSDVLFDFKSIQKRCTFYKKLISITQINRLRMAEQHGIGQREMQAKVKITMKMKGWKLWGPRKRGLYLRVRVR